MPELPSDDAPAPYRVAAIQFEPKLFAKEANLAALLRLSEEAAAGGARLIVTPEMATTAYCWAHRDEISRRRGARAGSRRRSGSARSPRATDAGSWSVCRRSIPETGVFYNSAVLIGPDGPVGLYRKTHAFISEPKWAKDGDLGLPVFETPIGRIAMTICMDACYPETARVPALAGADVICFPTNWLSEKSPSPSWMARAAENGVYFVAANRYGLERGVQFSGGSAVIDPDGSRAKRARHRGRHCLGLDRRRPRPRQAPTAWPARGPARRPPSRRLRDDDAQYLPLAAGRFPRAVRYSPAARTPEVQGGRRPVCARRRRRRRQSRPHRTGSHGLAGNRSHRASPSSPSPVRYPQQKQAKSAGGDGHPDPRRDAAERDRREGERRTSSPASSSATCESERLFNTAVLIGPEGLIGLYRKVHLSAEDRAWAARAADSPPSTFRRGASAS